MSSVDTTEKFLLNSIREEITGPSGTSDLVAYRKTQSL